MKKIILLITTLALLGGTAFAFEDVTPETAYFKATNEPNTYILDVRTNSEWTWVGHPGVNNLGEGKALAGKLINISYKIEYKKDFIVNPSFLSDVQEMFPNPAEVTLIAMCRSGKRSVAAAQALEAIGYVNMKNMVTGFEGGKDAAGYRTVNGWANDGLPYNYSGEGYDD